MRDKTDINQLHINCTNCTNCTKSTATIDLIELVEKFKSLARSGEVGAGTTYFLIGL
jgi:ATP-dependent DNA helicase RecG